MKDILVRHRSVGFFFFCFVFLYVCLFCFVLFFVCLILFVFVFCLFCFVLFCFVCLFFFFKFWHRAMFFFFFNLSGVTRADLKQDGKAADSNNKFTIREMRGASR